MPVYTGEKIVRHRGRTMYPGVKGRFKDIPAMVIYIRKNGMMILRVYTPESRTQDPPYEIKEIWPGDPDLVLD